MTTANMIDAAPPTNATKSPLDISMLATEIQLVESNSLKKRHVILLIKSIDCLFVYEKGIEI